MGQLEKYGLYVLCLVIFLILGVTLWGGDAVVPPAKQPIVASDAGRSASAAASTKGSGAADAFDLLLGSGGDEPKGDKKPAGGGTTAAAPGAGSGGAGNGGSVATDASGTRTPAVPASDAGGGSAKPDAATVKYKVQDGDTFDSLARTKLGSASLWPEIQRLNPTIKPERLRAGDEIVLPTAAAIAAKDAQRSRPAIDKPLAQAPDGKRWYTVRKGDTFDRIAQRQLGTARRAKELMALNAEIKPEKLRPNTRIELPPQ